MKRLIEDNEKLNQENQNLKKDINKITQLKESNKNKETIGERVVKLTNEISSLEKQLDQSEDKISYLEKENNKLRNEIENLKNNKTSKKEEEEDEDEEDSEEFREEMIQLKQKEEILEKENENMKNKISELTQEINSIKEENKNLKNEKETEKEKEKEDNKTEINPQ